MLNLNSENKIFLNESNVKCQSHVGFSAFFIYIYIYAANLFVPIHEMSGTDED